MIFEYLPGNEISMIEYECLPSYSSIQFAEIVDMDESVIVRAFSMRAGNDNQINK